GLSPVSDSLAPVLNGCTISEVIHFTNFDTIRFNGSLLTIHSLQVDSIKNLPAGTCWATDTVNNTWGNKGHGCIRVTGPVCAAPGQYQLEIWVTVDVGFTLPTNATAAGLYYYVRVNNAGDSIRPVDTTNQAHAPLFIGYKNGTETANCSSSGLNVSLG